MPFDRLLCLIFPPKCIFCGALTDARSPAVCPKCLDAIRLSAARAPRPEGAFFRRAVTALTYEGPVRKAMHRFKFSGKQSFAAPLAQVLAYAVRQQLDAPVDLIVPVPTNRANLRKRGYNHAALLARELSRRLDAPWLDALGKRRETRPMFGLRAAQRRANVLGAFALAAPPEAVQGRHILVVDDIITTGATVSECARILLEGGAASVSCAAVAAVRKGESHAAGQKDKT
jgi:ComF family protein